LYPLPGLRSDGTLASGWRQADRYGAPCPEPQCAAAASSSPWCESVQETYAFATASGRGVASTLGLRQTACPGYLAPDGSGGNSELRSCSNRFRSPGLRQLSSRGYGIPRQSRSWFL